MSQIVCGDMLGADLSNAAIVLLTSQCWDAPLAHRVHVKLATELPAGESSYGVEMPRSWLMYSFHEADALSCCSVSCTIP